VVTYNPFDPAVLADPYPHYAPLRADDPVHWLDSLGTYVITRYDDVVALLRQPNLFSSAKGMGDLLSLAFGSDKGAGKARLTGASAVSRSLIASDPPVHTDLRRLVSRAFTPRAIAELEPRIRQIAEELVDGLVERGEGDFVADLAYPLPVIVIAELLGIPPERRSDFKRWSDAIVSAFTLSADAATTRTQALEMIDYFIEIVAQRKAKPGSDMISILVTRGADGEDALTLDELVGFSTLLLVAGNETTTNLLGNSMRILFERPDVLARVREDHSFLPQMLEEVLRFDAPVQCLFRATTEPTELSGVELPAGVRVMPVFGSANRDDRRFPDAQRFDLNRRPADHVGFGQGVHLCLGAPLARLEARIAMETLFNAAGTIELAGEIVGTTSFLLRGCTSMPLKVDAA
jgi:cytochrome P450